ncbi:MAG: dTDP-4-dehydrorhamnose 3,5-epimerase family protein [Gammaproteobacteria bacterium]|nr:dTDP-4-dehydrorhamnose 3,5-epimerase family protein [Gammaproteobacteria bacterium]
MRFTPTELPGSFIVHIEPVEDARGFFARLWCREEFAARGITMDVVQVSISHNAVCGTLRGLHFQWPPSAEAKLVRCERGRVHDVIVDLRPDSATFTRHMAVELDSRTHNALFVPPGFAHGFQTLETDSDVVYMMSDYYRPELSDGVRFDDPEFGIPWPLPVACIAERDRDYPDFDRRAYSSRVAAGRAESDYSGATGKEPGR